MGKPWGWSPQGEPKRLWSAFRSHPAQLEQGACPGKPPLSLHALQSEILRFLWCLGFCFLFFSEGFLNPRRSLTQMSPA